MIRLWLPGARPVSPNRTRGEAWAVTYERRRKEHMLMKAAIGDQQPKRPIRSCVLTFVNHHARSPQDWSNFGAGIKGYEDGLVRAKVILDDNPSVVLELRLRQRKVATVKEEGIEILVEEA